MKILGVFVSHYHLHVYVYIFTHTKKSSYTQIYPDKHTDAQQTTTCVHLCPIVSVMSDSLRPYGLYSSRLLCPQDSPVKNTGVGCHALLQGTFQIWGLNPCILTPPALAGGSFTTTPIRKPTIKCMHLHMHTHTHTHTHTDTTVNLGIEKEDHKSRAD